MTRSELTAIEIALDELISYVDTVGAAGSLDDEEMPTEKLEWTIRVLKRLCEREARKLGRPPLHAAAG